MERVSDGQVSVQQETYSKLTMVVAHEKGKPHFYGLRSSLPRVEKLAERKLNFFRVIRRNAVSANIRSMVSIVR